MSGERRLTVRGVTFVVRAPETRVDAVSTAVRSWVTDLFDLSRSAGDRAVGAPGLIYSMLSASKQKVVYIYDTLDTAKRYVGPRSLRNDVEAMASWDGGWQADPLDRTNKFVVLGLGGYFSNDGSVRLSDMIREKYYTFGHELLHPLLRISHILSDARATQTSVRNGQGEDTITYEQAVRMEFRKLGIDPNTIPNVMELATHYEEAFRAFETNLATNISGRSLTYTDVDGTVRSTGEVAAGFTYAGRDLALKRRYTEEEILRLARNHPEVFGRFATMQFGPKCFAAGTPILMADGTHKPIEQVAVGDWVASFDQTEDRGRGPLKPGRVKRLYRNREEVFDYLGLRTTPGHHWIDGTTGLSERIDHILELDGAVLRDDGTRVRARTGFRVGGNDDRPVQVIWRTEAGEWASMLMRAGTICMTDKDDPMLLVSILAAMRRQGCELRDDGLFSDASGDSAPFLWPHGVPPAHLEIGAEISFRELLRMVKTQWPLTAFIGPADDSGPAPRRRPPVAKTSGGNRHERRAAVAKSRKDSPGIHDAARSPIETDDLSGGHVTHVGAESPIGAQLGS